MFFGDLQSWLKESIVLLTALGAVTHLAALMALAQGTATNTDWSLIVFAGTCKRAVLSLILLLKICIKESIEVPLPWPKRTWWWWWWWWIRFSGYLLTCRLKNTSAYCKTSTKSQIKHKNSTNTNTLNKHNKNKMAGKSNILEVLRQKQ